MFNVLISAITIIIKLLAELVKMVKISNGTKALDQFDYELISFQRKMWEKVVKVFKPFLQFLNFFDANYVHSMLIIMLNLQFKSL